GQFESFESSLTGEKIDTIIQKMSARQVNLSLPKFTFQSDFKLKDTLDNMGMNDAFVANAADFSGITGERDLYISEVIHKSFVAVDEEGTEAAAATAVIAPGSGTGPQDSVSFTADRPFIFLIRDRATQTILFIGRVMNPNEA
ncbi:MAG: serpin family protein, partial [Desulfobacteraceae bacterium]